MDGLASLELMYDLELVTLQIVDLV